MAVTTAKIRAREKATGKKAFTGIDAAGGLHYAFDKPTLASIIQKANVAYNDSQSAKAVSDAMSIADYNNQFNAAQAQKQMDFQERMSSTSHQREVKDLIAAGLNPVLSANNGASSPSGASASADTGATGTRAQLLAQQMQVGAQLAINDNNIASAQIMAKWQNDLNKELQMASMQNAKDVANIQAAASMFNAQQAASAQTYSAAMAAAASRYGADQSAAASKYKTDNPDNISSNVFKYFKSVFDPSKTSSAKSWAQKGMDFTNSIFDWIGGAGQAAEKRFKK